MNKNDPMIPSNNQNKKDIDCEFDSNLQNLLKILKDLKFAGASQSNQYDKLKNVLVKLSKPLLESRLANDKNYRSLFTLILNSSVFSEAEKLELIGIVVDKVDEKALTAAVSLKHRKTSNGYVRSVFDFLLENFHESEVTINIANKLSQAEVDRYVRDGVITRGYNRMDSEYSYGQTLVIPASNKEVTASTILFDRASPVVFNEALLKKNISINGRAGKTFDYNKKHRRDIERDFPIEKLPPNLFDIVVNKADHTYIYHNLFEIEANKLLTVETVMKEPLIGIILFPAFIFSKFIEADSMRVDVSLKTMRSGLYRLTQLLFKFQLASMQGDQQFDFYRVVALLTKLWEQYGQEHLKNTSREKNQYELDCELLAAQLQPLCVNMFNAANTEKKKLDVLTQAALVGVPGVKGAYGKVSKKNAAELSMQVLMQTRTSVDNPTSGLNLSQPLSEPTTSPVELENVPTDLSKKPNNVDRIVSCGGAYATFSVAQVKDDSEPQEKNVAAFS